MKKLMITVNGKRYEVDVEVVHDDDVIENQPAFRPPVRTVDSYVTPVNAPIADAGHRKGEGGISRQEIADLSDQWCHP